MRPEIYWLAFQQYFYAAPSVGLSLLEHFQHPSRIFEASLSDLKAVGGAKADAFCEKRNQIDWKFFERGWQAFSKFGGTLVTWQDSSYPRLLRELPDPPLVLSARGDVTQWNALSWIALVGARKATPYGKRLAYELAQQLAEKGVGVLSGLAYGIDAKAHEGALAGGGATWGVMGTGLQTVYPSLHAQLVGEMQKKEGGILTEFPWGMEALPHHFPQRNRIISGMSLGVVVVEAAQDSGSLITARLALEQNREVFAVPGPIGNPNVQGTHQLIKQGAKLVEGAWDILSEIRPLRSLLEQEKKKEESLLFLKLSSKPKTVDQLAYESGLSVSETLAELTTLESQGKIKRFAGPQFAVRK